VADFLVDNGGGLEELDTRVDEVWQELLIRRDAKAAAGATGRP
jgi:dephospho-CoA kinase